METKSHGKCYRINPHPKATELLERLPVGYKFGNVPHGGFEILDGVSSDFSTSDAVMTAQAEIVTVLAPFVDMDIYWGPSFRVWQHGTVMEGQSHVQVFTPRNAGKSLYLRRPCILFSTEALDQRLLPIQVNLEKPPLRDPYLEAAKVVACEIAYQLLTAEIFQHTHQEFFYKLAESAHRSRMKSWEEAERFLGGQWQGFVKGQLMAGIEPKHDPDATFSGEPRLFEFFQAIWKGSAATYYSRFSSGVETADYLNSLLPRKLPSAA